MTKAEQIAATLAEEYGLSYPMRVNLEAIVNKMLLHMRDDEAAVIDCLEDLFDNMFRFEVGQDEEG